MSRSYKKTAGFCDRSPFAKKEANGRVRRTPDLPNGSGYKKVYESWNIHDFKCIYWPNKDLVWWTNGKPYKARMK